MAPCTPGAMIRPGRFASRRVGIRALPELSAGLARARGRSGPQGMFPVPDEAGVGVLRGGALRSGEFLPTSVAVS